MFNIKKVQGCTWKFQYKMLTKSIFSFQESYFHMENLSLYIITHHVMSEV